MLCLSGFKLYSRWVPLFYASVMKVLKVTPVVRRKKTISSLLARRI